ncbi:MAG: FHA domain-containing protein [Chloroflexi bacterium]|nr:FHA domain-containing protein [Chloroflexota bacterium]
MSSYTTQSSRSTPEQPPGIGEDTEQITLYILSTRQKLTIPLKTKITLGRSTEPDTEGNIYIDLTPFYAHQLGVSRRHLMLVQDNDQRLMAFDLSSQNGSFLNGQRMSSHKGYPVNDGDELMLGSLSIRVYCTDEIPFSQPERSFPGKLTQHPETHASLPYPEPDIRETLETRPLQPRVSSKRDSEASTAK